jgi:hypothetical protein
MISSYVFSQNGRRKSLRNLEIFRIYFIASKRQSKENKQQKRRKTFVLIPRRTEKNPEQNRCRLLVWMGRQQNIQNTCLEFPKLGEITNDDNPERKFWNFGCNSPKIGHRPILGLDKYL